jgi:hypothetical protein
LKIFFLILITALSGAAQAETPARRTAFPQCDSGGGGGTDNVALAMQMFEQVLHTRDASALRLTGKNTSGKNLDIRLSSGSDLQMIMTVDNQASRRAASICQRGNSLIARVDTGYSYYPQADFVLRRTSNNKIHITGHAVNSDFTASAR